MFTATDASGNNLLFLRPLDALEARALPGTEGATYPFWSPEGRYVGFFAKGKLKKIDIAGGPPQTLCDAAHNRGATWSRNGVIVFAPDYNGPLYRVSDRGGPATPVTALDASRQENFHRFPLFLPDGQHLLYVAWSPNPEHTGIYLGSLDSNESRKLADAYSSVAYYSGHLLYVRGKTLMAWPFDVSRLELSGQPFPVTEQVGSFAAIGKAHFSVSESDWSSDGRFILYEASRAATNTDLWALPLDGDRTPIPLVQSGYSDEDGRLSPDGQWLAYTSDESGRREVYVRPFMRPGRSQLISTGGGWRPLWRRKDGEELFYLSPERRVMSVSVQSGPTTFRASVPRVVVDEPVDRSFSVSADGQRFLIPTALPEASAPIRVVVNWMLETK